MRTLEQIPGVGPTEESLALQNKIAGLRTEFLEAMRDDFNTALAISHMFALGREINTYYQHVVSTNNRPDGKLVNLMKKVFAEMCSIIGVLEKTASEESADAGLENALVEMMIGLRQEARQNKNYAQADALRDKLAATGIILEDTPQGVRWKRQ